jgi:uncharacterized membrane protein
MLSRQIVRAQMHPTAETNAFRPTKRLHQETQIRGQAECAAQDNPLRDSYQLPDSLGEVP